MIAGVAVLPGHLLAFEQAAWISAAAGTAGMAMHFLDAVRSALAGEIVAFHAPEKPRPLLVPVTSTAWTSARSRRRAAGRLRNLDAAAEFADKALGLAIGFRHDSTPAARAFGALAAEFATDVTTLAAGGAFAIAIAKPQLHGFVPVALRRAELQEHGRARLQNGDRDGVSLLVVDLCCADLLAEDAFAHNGCLVITCRWDQVSQVPTGC